MNKQGFTLIEVMVVVSIMVVVMGALFGMAISFSDSADVQDIKIITNDEARRALQVLIPELRGAAKVSIDWSTIPGDSITYRVAIDLDGNGSAVDMNGTIELSTQRTVQRDVDDLNNDGFTETQLIRIDGETITVLANNVSPGTEQPDDDGVFGPAQDTNGNGRMDRGFWIESRNGGLKFSLQTLGTTRRQHELTTEVSAFVVPRN